MAVLNFDNLWKSILTDLEPSIPAVAMDIWLRTLKPLCIVSGKLILLADSELKRNVVTKTYRAHIENILERYHDGTLDGVEIITPTEEPVFLEYINEQAKIIEEQQTEPSNFIAKYTFDNFVVGKSNEFVAAVCKAVADNPGKRNNPLFIYGPSGLGKTHLMHAIGNRLHQMRPDLKCLYVSSEHFTNNLIEALRDSNQNDEMKRFRAKYRNVDVLMIDDIQFIAKTVSTQEEFFHTFNDLYNLQKQIVITSDRPPKEIKPLEERLRTRFEGGIIADVQPPDLETRIAILQKKAMQEGFAASNGLLRTIAEKVQSNVREMEGLLSKVISYATLTGKTAEDPVVLNEALKDFRDDRKEIINIDLIVGTVCDYFHVEKDALIGKKKNKEIVEPRQLCIYLITELLTLPLTSVGQYFGNRDHTTIMHARDKVAGLVQDNDTRTVAAIKDIKDKILSR